MAVHGSRHHLELRKTRAPHNIEYVMHQLADPFAGCASRSCYDLRFIGFELEPSVLQHYLSRFPADTAMIDRASWDFFEREKPGHFFGDVSALGAEEIVMAHKVTL